MAARNGDESDKSDENAPSERDVREQSSKIATQATEAHDKATELMQAATAAGDPDECQKLMEKALEQQVQSGSLGKTAKYLRSGTFQGMAVGAGLGIAPGASLGAITGTLVGGVSSTALGGVGAGLGAATGALHGPFWNIGKGAGKGIQKLTGNLPGWKATESQKKQLEKMVGQINEQDAPGQDELKSWGRECTGDDSGKSLGETQLKQSESPPSTSRKTSNHSDKQSDDAGMNEGEPTQRRRSSTERGVESGQQDTNGVRDEGRNDNSNAATETDKIEARSFYKDASVQTGEGARKKPRKLRSKSHNTRAPSPPPASLRKSPRKLERRSK